jgi:hypothetical protein
VVAGQSSWGLAFSSIRAPEGGASLTVDGGSTAFVTGIPTPGAVDFPEPGSLAMLAVGGLLISRRRR